MTGPEKGGVSRPIDPSKVAIVCHGDETYGVGTSVKLYAQYMPEALFVTMREGPLTQFLRQSRCRLVVAGIEWSFVPGSTANTLRRMPAALKQARREAEKLWPMLGAHDIRVFHSPWLSEQLIGGYLRRHGVINAWHIQNNMNRQRLFGFGVQLNHLLARRFADVIMAVSGFIAENWEGCGRPVVTVFNAARPEHAAASPMPAGPFRCLVAGRLEESKGHHLAVEAVIAARKAGLDVMLDVFGGPVEDNPYAEGLKRRIAQTGNDAYIALKGFVNDLRRRHRGYHLGLQCRIDPEPCSLWICEAHADGLPLLASASGGTPELVVEGETGRLYAPGDQEDITRKLLEMLCDKEKLEKMRGAAFERGRAMFHPQRMVSETLAAYARGGRA